MKLPRIMIGSARKSSGKTTISIGIAAALTARGMDVRPFKKGPDFIDPRWLARASARECRNLDFFIMGRERILENFHRHAQGCDLALIEGNHGFFDGQDLEGGDCGAALASLLQTPVVLVVDGRGASRGVAPLILGHLGFPGGEAIAGIIFNHVASPRHERRLLEAMKRYVPVPVLGFLARREDAGIQERHLGLEPVEEREELAGRIEVLGRMVAEGVDLDALVRLAETAPPLGVVPEVATPSTLGTVARIRVGYAVDQAFHFYYPDNLEALAHQGVDLVPFSMLQSRGLPLNIQGLYIGGGFPEVFMRRLEKNTDMMDALAQVAREGMPIYAECGGLMVLAEKIHWGGEVARMAGALPVEVAMHAKPQGHGYMELEGTDRTNWPGEGVRVACHEFHYSRVVRSAPGVSMAFRVRRGFGVDGEYDGLIHGNVLACYAHFHAAGRPGWAGFLADFWRKGL